MQTVKILSSRGFAATTALLITVVVAAIGATGWYVWATKHDKPTSSSVKSTPTQKDKAAKKVQSSDPSEGGKFLVISEWDIRIPLPQSLQGDITYGLRANASTHSEVASFEVGQLVNIPGNNCKLSTESDGGKSGGIGNMLIRQPTALAAPAGAGTPVYTSQDGTYAYYATGLKALCIASSEYESLQLQTGDTLYKALADLEETPN